MIELHWIGPIEGSLPIRSSRILINTYISTRSSNTFASTSCSHIFNLSKWPIIKHPMFRKYEKNTIDLNPDAFPTIRFVMVQYPIFAFIIQILEFFLHTFEQLIHETIDHIERWVHQSYVTYENSYVPRILTSIAVSWFQ